MDEIRNVERLVEIVWDYMQVGYKLRRADCIFVLCSHDIRVADYAIELYKAGYAPWLLFSGSVIQQDAALKVFWDMPEADYFACRARADGLPADRILIENRSRNTA